MTLRKSFQNTKNCDVSFLITKVENPIKISENKEEFNKDGKSTTNILMHFLPVFFHSVFCFVFKHSWNHTVQTKLNLNFYLTFVSLR